MVIFSDLKLCPISELFSKLHTCIQLKIGGIRKRFFSSNNLFDEKPLWYGRGRNLLVPTGSLNPLDEWLESLVGATGVPGATGEAGEDGKSAYELAVENGFEGSLEEWLTSLVGSSGEDGTDEKLGNAFRLGWPAVAFVLAVLSLFNLIPSPILAACMLVFLLIADRDSLKKVDYSLLITFIALFIFIGNIGRIPEFRSFLSGILEGRVTIMGVALSQIISNVPAALLLSGFTSEWKEILIGVNLGGLGTLIASMASLISYKAIAKEYPNAKGKYILRFTIFNVAFLGVLIGLYYLLAAL